MDRPVLIVEVPELDDKAVVGLQTFLQELLLAFEAHYYQQLKRAQHCSQEKQDYHLAIEDEDPF